MTEVRNGRAPETNRELTKPTTTELLERRPFAAQQPYPYSHALRRNSDSLAVKKWRTLSGLRTKNR